MTTSAKIGFALCRIIVPLWVLAGAAFKLYERTPSNLPSGLLAVAKNAGVDLDMLLRLLIGLEFFAVGVMFFVPRFARAMAIFMLSCFCGILVWELIRQQTSCGCFGSIKLEPWQMLAIDGTLLLLTIFFSPRAGSTAKPGEHKRSLVIPGFASIVLLALGLVLAFAVPDRASREQVVLEQPRDVPAVQATQPDVSVAQPTEAPPPSQPTDPTINPKPMAIPNSWYAKVPVDKWVGRPWRDLEIFQLMPRWPKNMDTGKRYVVFYSRTCEHCRDMFLEDLIIPLDAPVTAVEIPQSPTVLTAPDAWDMLPLEHVERLSLPLGCNWIIQPPLALTLQDGVVTCANEGNHKACFGLP